MAELVTKNITTQFDGRTVIKDISICLHNNEIVSLLGVSGAGKTTLFNIISGLLAPEQGQIILNGEDITGKAGKISYMMQKDLLLPYRTIEDNVSLPLIVKGEKKKKALEMVRPYFKEFGLEGIENKYLSHLSGGMRQRVILAQALLGQPQILILDEPTAGLDPKERLRLRKYIADLAEDRIVFLTTHIVSDIESIAKDVLLMRQGEVVASGSPEKLMAQVGGSGLEDVYMAYLGED